MNQINRSPSRLAWPCSYLWMAGQW